MIGTIFVIRDAAERPRAGQNVTLRYHETEVRGSVYSFHGDCVQIRPASLTLLRTLRTGTRLIAQMMTGNGTLESTLSLLGCQGDLASLQLVGLPSLMQRRGHPRVPVRLGVTLTWVSARHGGVMQARATTQNVSMGGTLIRFPEPRQPLPPEGSAILLELDLPAGVLSLPIRLLQVWESGARVRFLELTRDADDDLRTFIEPRLNH